jgi:hypothetical protein
VHIRCFKINSSWSWIWDYFHDKGQKGLVYFMLFLVGKGVVQIKSCNSFSATLCLKIKSCYIISKGGLYLTVGQGASILAYLKGSLDLGCIR